MKIAAIAAVLLLTVAGCSYSDVQGITVSKTAGPPKSDASYELHCGVRYDPGTQLTVSDYHDGWAYPRGIACVTHIPQNRLNRVAGPLSQKQIDALATAYPNGLADEYVRELTTLYGMCAETGSLAMSNLGGARTYSRSQAREMRGVMLLCPDHPSIDSWKNRMPH